MARYVLFVIAGFLFGGCLASDPKLTSMDLGEQVSESKWQVRKTRAPIQIAPSILSARGFGEAPVLTEKVKRGDLPPISTRLPDNPLVVVPLEEIGTYGGDIRRALTGDIVQVAAISKSINENLMGCQFCRLGCR